MPPTHPRCPLEYRRRIIELAQAGRKIEALAREFEPSANAIRKWVKQTALDEGLRSDGLTTTEREELNRPRFKTQVEARMAVFDFIEGWYNPHRRHSALDYLSPINYERSHSAEADFPSPTPSTEAG